MKVIKLTFVRFRYAISCPCLVVTNQMYECLSESALGLQHRRWWNLYRWLIQISILKQQSNNKFCSKLQLQIWGEVSLCTLLTIQIDEAMVDGAKLMASQILAVYMTIELVVL